jgi:putative transposase
MIDRGHELPLTRQAALLRLSRGSLYYTPRPVPAGELAVMRRIDELHLNYPFAGSRMLRDLLRTEDIVIGREKVATFMRRMGIEAVYRRPNTSKPTPGHKIYPYLLRGQLIDRPTEPGLGHGYYVYPDGARFCVSGSGGGLVQPAGSGLEIVDHAGGGILHRGG